jgi:hypothetical protein
MHHSFVTNRLTALQRQVLDELNFREGDTARRLRTRRSDDSAIATAAMRVRGGGLSVAAAAREIHRALGCHQKTAERHISRRVQDAFKKNSVVPDRTGDSTSCGAPDPNESAA